MVNYQLDVEQANARFDPEKRIAFIHYHGVLGSDVTLRVYEWLDELYKEIGTDGFAGQIFDFRDVQEFDESNLATARKTSGKMNLRVDTSHIPVALIVSDFYHEEILRTAMRISPEHVRKKIVWSEDEALSFLNQWRTEHEPKQTSE